MMRNTYHNPRLYADMFGRRLTDDIVRQTTLYIAGFPCKASLPQMRSNVSLSEIPPHILAATSLKYQLRFSNLRSGRTQWLKDPQARQFWKVVETLETCIS